jgi:hypothetical protein
MARRSPSRSPFSDSREVEGGLHFEGFNLGKKAFAEGKCSTPARDPVLVRRLAEVLQERPEQGSITALLSGWQRGWHRSNLEAPVYLSDGTVLQLPK